ncbi:MAG: hypothetical protein PHS30_05465 [Bacteroidales bacterium]|nr:hypothetical protein [Bacteroidales bacterium]
MRRYPFHIYLFALLLVSMEVHAQADLENKIIASLLNDGNKLIPEYKTSKRKGWVKKFNQYKKPEFVLLNVTKSPLPEAEFDTIGLFEREVLSDKDRNMLHDFCRKNRSTLKIDSVKGLEDYITFLSPSGQKKIFSKMENWHAYYGDYGLKPLVKVSRPGFNDRKNKAFIYLTYSLGKNDGAGYYLVMKKIWWKWKVKGNMLIWVK